MKLSGRRCQCPACGQYFNSVYGFDKHRSGPYDHRRRCLDTKEMESLGMSKNTAGFWITSVLTSWDHVRDRRGEA